MSEQDNQRIMEGFEDVLQDFDDGRKKNYKIGMMIALMLKRSKLIDLMIKQANVKRVFNQYKHEHGETVDPPHKSPLEIQYNKETKERTLTLTFPLIQEWFIDTNYYKHIDDVIKLFKLEGGKKEFYKLLGDYLYFSEFERLQEGNPTKRAQNIKEAQTKAKKRIQNAKDKEILTLSSVYTEQLLHSSLFVDSRPNPDDEMKDDEIVIQMGNWDRLINHLKEVIYEKIAKHKNDSVKRKKEKQHWAYQLAVGFVVAKAGSYGFAHCMDNIGMAAKDKDGSVILKKPLIEHTEINLVPAGEVGNASWNVGAPLEIRSNRGTWTLLFYSKTIPLDKTYTIEDMKRAEEIYNNNGSPFDRQTGEWVGYGKKGNQQKQKEIMKTRFAATEEDVEKEKRERFEEMKKRQEMKGKQKVAVVEIRKPPAYDDDALVAMFGEDSGSNTKGKKNKKNKKNIGEDSGSNTKGKKNKKNKKNKKKKKKKKQEEESQDDDKKPPAPQSGKTSPLPQATAQVINGPFDEDLFKYLKKECRETDEVQIIIWSVINKYLKNSLFGEKGYYSGGFATYLLTKGKYPTTDIDYKIYPPQPGEKVDEAGLSEYLQKFAKPMFEDIKALLPKEMKDFFKELVIGKPKKNPDGPIKITLMLTKPDIIELKEPELDKKGTMIFSKLKYGIAYCDIGFWSPKDLINDLDLPFINGIYPKHDEALLDKLDMYVMDKDFMIEEKKIFLVKLDNPTMKHKIENWTNQLKLLEGLKGGRRRRTRRKKKYKKRRTKKKKKRTKKKRRKRRKKTRRRK